MADKLTETEELLRELQSSERRFRSVINRNADGTIILDPSGVVRFVNPAAVSLFDREANELLGTRFGFPVAVGETTELALKRRGETIVVEMRIVETEWDGEPALLASLRDITDRKRAEAERVELIREQAARAEAETARARLAFLAEAGTRLASSLNYEKTLADLARLAIPYLADYVIVDMLEGAGALKQMAVAHKEPAKEYLLKEMRRLYPFDTSKPCGVVRVVRTGRSEMISEVSPAWLTGAARDEKHLEMMEALGFKSYLVVPLVAGERTLGAVSFVLTSDRRYTTEDLALAEDLARRAALFIDNARLYKEAREANRLKDEFLTTLSHELRTPLTSVIGWAQLLRTRDLDRSSARYALDAIERNAKAQAQIVEDLLDTSDILKGNLRLKTEVVNLKDAVESALDATRPAADAKRIKIDAVITSSEDQVTGDFARLRQVIWNLLSNAIKFTPEGGQVRLTLARQGPDVEIAVSDTGTGINPEFLPFIFDHFRQADGSSTRENGGLGLGLTLVRYLVEMHGGTVSAASPGPGRGATFTVRLPGILASDKKMVTTEK
ncbi:MAG TPA: ATP-binding protein [Blastocatellia bacterium]|nr:ATP-binding protein [Blastocatellia bacterium]